MEGVMHQPKPVGEAKVGDRLDRFAFVAKRADVKAQRLNQTDQSPRLEHRGKRPERDPQVGLPFTIAAGLTVVARDQGDTFGTAVGRNVDQPGGLCLFGIGPVVKGFDFGQGKDALSTFPSRRRNNRRRITIEKDAVKVIPEFHPDAPQRLSHPQDSIIAQTGNGHVIERKAQH